MPISNVFSSDSKTSVMVRRVARGGMVCALALLTAGGAAAQALPPADAGAATGTAITGTTNDPCPMPSAELSRTPDDLGKIQADIDRYTLCMERAQLLQRLNTLAKENQDSLLGSTGVSASNPGMQLNSSLPDFSQQKQQLLGSVAAADVGADKASEKPAEPPKSEWFIVRILGAGSDLSAQIGKSDGTLARVRAGDALPGDDGRVTQVSATAVEVTQDGESKSLRWNGSDSR